jgi:proton-coupled amino acid transporter
MGKARVEDSDDDEDHLDPDLVNKTPVTKRRIKEEKVKAEVKKLSAFASYLTLIKGFVCTGVLYLPKAFINGGYAISIGMMIGSAILTIYCAMLLLEVRKKLNCSNYTELGQTTYGRIGRVGVDIALWSSQVGFCCAYVFFIMDNLSQIMIESLDVDIDEVTL